MSGATAAPPTHQNERDKMVFDDSSMDGEGDASSEEEDQDLVDCHNEEYTADDNTETEAPQD